MLLKQGAKLVENVNDILEEIAPQIMGPNFRDIEVSQDQKPAAADVSALNGSEMDLIEVISRKPQDVDTIIARSGRPTGEVIGMLTDLELRGYIAQLPGKMFVLK
jgi:DNA processing protein